MAFAMPKALLRGTRRPIRMASSSVIFLSDWRMSATPSRRASEALTAVATVGMPRMPLLRPVVRP